MSDFSSYFGSYAKVAPPWHDFIVECTKNGRTATSGWSPEYLSKQMDAAANPLLIPVTEENYPKIYQALKEECEFRNVPMPACYVDKRGNCRLGRAHNFNYSIEIEDGFHEFCSQKELRALIAHELKHLYQGDYNTPADSCKAEFDCDRAAVESTDYGTIKSYVHKAIEFRIKDKVPKKLQGLALLFHHTFPNAMEYIPVSIDAHASDLRRMKIVMDPWHPSPAERMKSMREYDASLKSCGPDLV